MEQLKVIKFLEENREYFFPNSEYTDLEIESALMTAPDTFEMFMKNMSFRKPSTVQIISVFPGSLGVDRFYLGDIVKGILKYFTFGGFGIWWIVDIFSAKNRCRAYNCKKLIDALHDPSLVRQIKDEDEKINKAFQVAKAAAPVIKELAKGARDVGQTFHIDN